jgi:hypothetical protein
MNRYKEKPGFKYRCHKWALCAWKGGHCIKCGERVTAGNIERFHFDHKEQVNNRNDKTDRWGGGIRDWPPFNDRWKAWAATVDLICVDCHQSRHLPVQPQLTLDLAAQERLNGHAPIDTTTLSQLSLFGDDR